MIFMTLSSPWEWGPRDWSRFLRQFNIIYTQKACSGTEEISATPIIYNFRQHLDNFDQPTAPAVRVFFSECHEIT